MAVSMGISRDSAGLVGGRTVEIPSFQVQIGAGQDLLGLEVWLFSNQASGRFHQKSTTTVAGNVTAVDMAVDRIAVDALLALHPFARRLALATSWSQRLVRSATLNLGAGAENASVGPPSVVRFGTVVGLHVDLPLSPATASSDLRLRLSARRMFAASSQAGTVTVTDTKLEAFGGLALVF
jgi:hypothetical protein